jgi:peroxiredoxin
MKLKSTIIGMIALTVIAVSFSSLAAAPTLLVQDIDGTTVDLSAMIEGKPTMVIAWATWCPHCTKQIPNIKLARERFAEKGLVVVAVNPGIRDTLDRMRRFAQVKELDYPIFFDPTQQATRNAFSIDRVPLMILYDRDGKEISRAEEVEFDKIEELMNAGEQRPDAGRK